MTHKVSLLKHAHGPNWVIRSPSCYTTMHCWTYHFQGIFCQNQNLFCWFYIRFKKTLYIAVAMYSLLFFKDRCQCSNFNFIATVNRVVTILFKIMESPENIIRTQILSQPQGTFWFNDCTRRRSPHAYHFQRKGALGFIYCLFRFHFQEFLRNFHA